MIFRLFRRPAAVATIDVLYGAIVAQARLPVFYEEFGVPDTVEGRFDMIPELNQALFDAFCRDMDHNLREMGVGDLTVPKKMKRFAEAFYGRLKAYDRALSGDDPAALAASLGRNVFAGMPDAGQPNHAERLARYARRAVAYLDTVDGTCFSRGVLAFPAPQADLEGDG
jgi:cytochrome b pre-mRNA-processing protein 3